VTFEMFENSVVSTGLATRFKDTREWIESFGRDLLINCPRCGQCASVTFVGAGTSIERTCICVACGYSDKCTVRGLPAYSYRSDWHKRLDLWLQTPCCGNVLWALNEKHLAFLESYVTAKLRQRRPGEFGWSNHSLSGRLPQWVTSAKNRDEVLRCIQRLKLRLPSR
jgi:transcription elongation factor Elf1